MKLYIKNMVCNRCIKEVRTEIEKLDFNISAIKLGEVELLDTELSANQKQIIATALTNAGFELIDNHKNRIVEKIKTAVIDFVHYNDELPQYKHSELISSKLNLDYQYISKVFSEVEGITIEQYIIQQKIEKIKEYIVYDELNLRQIALRMGYSSVAHLSAQFKKVTGLPPSHFKNMGLTQRKPLDKIGKQ